MLLCYHLSSISGDAEVEGRPVVEVIDDFDLTIEEVNRREITLVLLQGKNRLTDFAWMQLNA